MIIVHKDYEYIQKNYESIGVKWNEIKMDTGKEIITLEAYNSEEDASIDFIDFLFNLDKGKFYCFRKSNVSPEEGQKRTYGQEI